MFIPALHSWSHRQCSKPLVGWWLCFGLYYQILIRDYHNIGVILPNIMLVIIGIIIIHEPTNFLGSSIFSFEHCWQVAFISSSCSPSCWLLQLFSNIWILGAMTHWHIKPGFVGIELNQNHETYIDFKTLKWGLQQHGVDSNMFHWAFPCIYCHIDGLSTYINIYNIYHHISICVYIYIYV